MDRIISLGTQTFLDWFSDKSDDKIVDFLIETEKKSHFDGITFSFRTPKSLDFKFSDKQLRYISKKHISLMLPYKNGSEPIIYGQDDGSFTLINRINNIIKKLDSKINIINPKLVRDFSVLAGIKGLSVSNLPYEEGFGIDELERIFRLDNNISLAIDISYCFSFNKDFLPILLEKFRDRVSCILLSDRRDVRNNKSLFECKDLYKFEILRDLNCPVIINSNLKEYDKNISTLLKEINTSKKIFGM
jgi:hypothetical protein